MKKILFFVIVAFLFFTNRSVKKEEPYQEIKTENTLSVSLVAVGDNLIHDSVYQAAKIKGGYDFKPMLTDIKPYIRNFDLRFINQEAILGGVEIGLSSYPSFNSPFELGDALTDTGFNLISIANNHTLDRGEKAILNTIQYWDSQPVIYSGAGKNQYTSPVKLFNQKGIRFAFVAYTYGTNDIPVPKGKEYLVNVYSDIKAKNDLLRIRDLVDIIIVSMHWGDEYQDYPNQTQKKQAEYLSELGADIIIGHHPHVIQPIDFLNNHRNGKTMVIFSLGNFLSDQKGIDKLIGMAVSIEICKYPDGKIELKNPKAALLYRYKDISRSQFLMKLFQDLNEEILQDIDSYYEKKKTIIQAYYKDIEVI